MSVEKEGRKKLVIISSRIEGLTPLSCQSGKSSNKALGSNTAPDRMCAPTQEK